jgi:hypothetical protein
VKLTVDELGEIRKILEKIDCGRPTPRLAGRMGRFFRQYQSYRAALAHLLTESGVPTRADSAISGRAIGPIEISAMISPEVSSFGFPLGEIGETLAISEELGTVASVVMWLKGAVANSAYNLLCETLSLRLDGDYRWTPPSRLSPGEARLASRDSRLTWMHARCLKAVADDIERPPHAVEYILDYRMGPPGLKFFRCICAFKEGGRWMVVPCLKPPVPLAFEEGAPSGLRQSPASYYSHRVRQAAP